LSATAVGQETEVADAHEAWGEHVEEKAPQNSSTDRVIRRC